MGKRLVYIGGGVSTVFSLIKLLNEGYSGEDITVIEKGKSSKTRQPNEIMNGFFGAGSFSDFKNVYSLSQGGELAKYMGDEKANELMEQVKAIIRQFHPKPKDINTVELKEEPLYLKDSPFTLRQSQTEHLGTDYGQLMGKAIEKWFIEKGVEFLFETEVEDVDFENRMIHCKDKSIGYDKLIIATGKSGMNFLKRIIDKYKLPTSPKAAQIGVRFETEYKYFKALARDFYDFKLHQVMNKNVSMRTFCVNNEAAYVAIEETYGMKSFNGHAYKDRSKRNGLTNFGLMMEINGIKDPLKFTKSLVKRCNVGGKGKYYSPGIRRPNVEADRIKLVTFIELFGKYSAYIIKFINDLDKIFGFGDDYVFYVPEIKYLTNEISVNHTDLSLIDYPDVHIMGDALSSRGIVVAGCQGIYVSESLLK